MRSVIAGAALALSLLSGAALAQTAPGSAARVYDMGPVWEISQIEVLPGRFDDYMAYLNGPYRTLMEADKRAGNVLDYKVLAVNNTRAGEADVMLVTVFKNAAVFDESLDEQDRRTAKVFGSVPQATQAGIARGEMRKQLGSMQLREVKFKR